MASLSGSCILSEGRGVNDNDSYEERNRERGEKKETLTPPEEAGGKKNLFLFFGYPADDDVSIGWSPSTTTTQRKKKLTRYLGEVPHSHPSLVWVCVHQSALSALKGEKKKKKKKDFSSFFLLDDDKCAEGKER